jgi:carbohydrate kinase (thermoresistant glucokinase family)
MIVIVMGPMGSGKSTIGPLVAERLHIPFLDADDIHPASNREKLEKGIPLNDVDRSPWLSIIRGRLEGWKGGGPQGVLACSALKQEYRDLLGKDLDVRWIYLKGTADFLRKRIAGRKGHFASGEILSSQLADLEEPEAALWVDIRMELPIIVEKIVQWIEVDQ